MRAKFAGRGVVDGAQRQPYIEKNMPNPATSQTTVFYDGDCGLCQKSVQWLLDHDSEGRLQFAPLQGSTAVDALGERDELAGVDSIVFLEEKQLYLRSRAIFQIASYLDPSWRWLRHLRVFPAFLTDLGYRFIAKIRYRVWGKADVCRVPTIEERARFLP